MSFLLKRQLNEDEKAIILGRFGRRCYATGHEIPESETIQFDHIKAYAYGGPSELNNIAPMCEHHNKQKSALPLEDFRTKLRLEEFFRSGERLTLRDLLQFLKEKKTIESYGNSIRISEAENSVRIENHEVSSTYQVQVCPLTGWHYFYATLPISILDSDDDEAGESGLQPRFLIFDKVFEMFRHFQNFPVLQPSIGRARDEKILLFDGQHKAAALLLNGRTNFECKIYLNPDLRVLNQANIAAHDKYAQTRFFSSVLILKLGSQFGTDFEDYKNLEDGKPKTEAGFLGYLELKDSLTRAERNKRFRSYLYNSVMEDAENKLKPLISQGNRSSNEQPLTFDMLSKSIFGCFLYTEPTTDEMATEKYKREAEFKNLIRLQNTIFELGLFEWNSQASDPDRLRLGRVFSSKSMMAWSEILRDAVCAKLEIRDEEDRAKPFYRDLAEVDHKKIRDIVALLMKWQMWDGPANSQIDTELAGNKTTLKAWFKSKGLTSGYLLGAPE